jgi:hypothetical protein
MTYYYIQYILTMRHCKISKSSIPVLLSAPVPIQLSILLEAVSFAHLV